MLKKKRYENIVEYQFLGKTVAKKVILPYGYTIDVKDKTIYKKIKIEKLLAYHEEQIFQRLNSQTYELASTVSAIKDSVSEHNQHANGKQNVQMYKLHKKLDILNSVQTTHQETFKPFKNKFHGQDIVLVATGPTLKQYEPVKGALHIGVNNAYKFKPVTLDFLFIQDVLGLKEQMPDINAYGLGQCQKFYGDVLFCDHCAIPESYVIQTGAKRYYTGGMGSPFLHDIASCLLPDFGSVVFPALAFALYTNPKRLYLAGCDCSDIGYFDSDKPGVSPSLQQDIPHILKGWQAFKQFAEHFYPDTEIISINPVGLKGMFKEIENA